MVPLLKLHHRASTASGVACAQAGPVARISVPEEAPGIHKGYAFCQYEDLVRPNHCQLLMPACFPGLHRALPAHETRAALPCSQLDCSLGCAAGLGIREVRQGAVREPSLAVLPPGAGRLQLPGQLLRAATCAHAGADTAGEVPGVEGGPLLCLA